MASPADRSVWPVILVNEGNRAAVNGQIAINTRPGTPRLMLEPRVALVVKLYDKLSTLRSIL